MTTSTKPEFPEPENSDPVLNEISGQETNPVELPSDPEYLKLLELYQRAEFTECKDVLDQLEIRYPEHPILLKFKQDLQMKMSLKKIAVSIREEEKHKKKKVALNLSIFAFIGTLIVMIAFFFSYNYFNTIVSGEQLDQETAQLLSLNDQVEQLLLRGQPQPAAEILEMMMTINPEYENLPELISRKDDLLQLEAQYQAALNLVAENKSNEALVILKDIETEKPGLWDVRQQIASVETSIQIAKYFEEGNAAYQAEMWGQVISAYENALKLDTKLDDPLMKEHLLKGYLNQIINMLQDENASIEDIETAAGYYRKAVALIPQSRAFASERGNLQEASSNLLELKYTQTAKASLEDKNQTLNSIARAVSYLRKAANINPNNTALQLDLQNAEYYQIGLQNFINMNWAPAVTNFNQVLAADSNYANGNANVLLFEAYYALGKQYYSAGIYQDALNNLEQAEILAWDDDDNLMKLFQVQVLLGDTLGKMGDYQNAVSYYQYGLNAIRVVPRLTNHPAIASIFDEAEYLAANGNYENAFAAFQEVLKDFDVVYSISELEISDGVILALFANENLSTTEAVIEANNLPREMIITFGRKLNVPMFEK